MPKIDRSQVKVVVGTLYPRPFDEPCLKRRRERIGDAAGLTQFGANLCTLPPGVASSQRHWHSHSDELIYVVSGSVVLVTDAGEQTLSAGDFAGFKAGEPYGHCFQNRSDDDVVLMEIGTRDRNDATVYPDLDMITKPGEPGYFHRDGTPYPQEARRA